jgi:hypothetical protein
MEVVEKNLFLKKLKYVMIKNKIKKRRKKQNKKKARASFLPPNPKVNGAFTSPIMA